MGFIQLKLPKRLRLKLPNTSSLRKAREEYRKWLKERGLDKLKPRNKTEEFKFEPVVERTGVPLGNKIPVSGGKKREQLFYSGKRKLIGIATIFISHVFINTAMTVGLIPVKGLPFPFISAGGSFLISCFLMVGLVLNLSVNYSD